MHEFVEISNNFELSAFVYTWLCIQDFNYVEICAWISCLTNFTIIRVNTFAEGLHIVEILKVCVYVETRQILFSSHLIRV